MNYRHAFHAGNFADVLKHALLARILDHLRLKPKPFRVVDTHAGIGRYDLGADEAVRTGEWRDGVGRLDRPFAPEVEEVLAPYRAALARCREQHGERAYPGSPEIIATALRAEDAAILIEKHPEDAATLARRYRRHAGVKVLQMDGWTGLRSLIPPKERRGLVLIDPPYEMPGEIDAAMDRLRSAHRRWPTGMLMLWYPMKGATPARAMPADTSSLRIELTVSGAAAGKLSGTGLMVVNPPWTLRREASLLLPALAERLAQDAGASWSVEASGVEDGATGPSAGRASREAAGPPLPRPSAAGGRDP